MAPEPRTHSVPSKAGTARRYALPSTSHATEKGHPADGAWKTVAQAPL